MHGLLVDSEHYVEPVSQEKLAECVKGCLLRSRPCSVGMTPSYLPSVFYNPPLLPRHHSGSEASAQDALDP